MYKVQPNIWTILLFNLSSILHIINAYSHCFICNLLCIQLTFYSANSLTSLGECCTHKNLLKKYFYNLTIDMTKEYVCIIHAHQHVLYTIYSDNQHMKRKSIKLHLYIKTDENIDVLTLQGENYDKTFCTFIHVFFCIHITLERWIYVTKYVHKGNAAILWGASQM